MALEHGMPLLVAAIPLLSVSYAGRWLALVPVALGVVGPVVRYLRFRYRISGEMLVIEGGLLFHWRREIPFARIQSVDSVQKLRHQLFGVVELRVEVVGGRATEASFPALQSEEAERIRSILLERSHVPREEDPSRPHLAQLGPGDLLLAGATGGRVAVVALLLGYAQELLPEETATSWFERLAQSGPAVIAGVVLGALVVSVVISLIATVVVYWDFTVRREGRRVHITRGLLERRKAFIPLNRVQALRIHANPVRRVLGLASVSAVLAGYNAREQEGQETSMVLPIARRGDAFHIVCQLLDIDINLESLELEELPSRALVHRLLYPVVAAVALGVGSWALLGGPGAFGFVLVPIVVGWSWLAWQGAGHALAGDHFLVRSGALFRRYYVVPVANVQHLQLIRSPLQRALSLATLRVRIPKASPAVAGLDGVRATERFEALSAMMQRIPRVRVP
jgi:putative membrane protein